MSAWCWPEKGNLQWPGAVPPWCPRAWARTVFPITDWPVCTNPFRGSHQYPPSTWGMESQKDYITGFDSLYQ